jgi:predicted RNase H-like HicB family nuclease
MKSRFNPGTVNTDCSGHIDMDRFSVHYRSMKYYTVSTAKPKLGRLLDNMLSKGEPVIIRRGHRFVQLCEYIVPDPNTPLSPRVSAVAEVQAEYGGSNGLHFKINLFKSKEGWSVSCPELPGCHSQGKTRTEALDNIRNAIRLWLEVETEDTGLTRLEQAELHV